jgi:hypothetical protein
MRYFIVSFAMLVCLSRTVLAAPGDLLFKLTAPDPQPGAAFGKVLSIVDGDILVGEPARLDLPIDAPGRAYLYDGKSGQLKLTFDNPQPTDQDKFAGALAGGDGRVFIPAVGLDERVYAFSATTGQLLQTIREPDARHTSFGSGLAYGSGSLLVAAPSYSGVPYEAQSIGRAYLFDAATGMLQRPLANPEPNAFDGFPGGMSLAVVGDTAIAAVLFDSAPAGPNAGRVWGFDRTTGAVRFVLENPQPESRFGDWFGFSVAADAERIVVGAQEDSSSGVDGSGTVYVFDSHTGVLQHTLFSPQLEVNGEFGRSVAITPDGNVLVGAWNTSVNGLTGAGHAYLYDGTTGKLLLDIPNPEPTQGIFGWSVAASDDRLIIGAPAASSDGMPSVGAVYVFEAIPEPSSLALLTALIVIFLCVWATRTFGRNANPFYSVRFDQRS